MIQGRLNDLGMLLSGHLKRDAATGDFSGAALVACEDALRLARLSHVFFWAAIVRAAPSDNYDTSFNALLSSRGLGALVTKGALSPAQGHKRVLRCDVSTSVPFEPDQSSQERPWPSETLKRDDHARGAKNEL